MLDYLVFLIVRAVIFIIGLFPSSLMIFILGGFFRFVSILFPAYLRIAHKNLKQAFPAKSKKERSEIIKESCYSLARIIVDFARTKRLGPDWIDSHITFPPKEILDKLSRTENRQGVLFATGHLGSFELLAHAASVRGFPISFVVRNFKNDYLDKWWNGRRGSGGNRVISRRGAFNEVITAIKAGVDVGLLFDQNVKKNHAVFVDFFGRQAATTKTIGIAALRTEAVVMVVSIKYQGSDHYRINCVECNFSDLYKNENLSSDEKVVEITQVISREYQKMVEADPGAWFWMHRRWKTTQDGAEDFYKS